MMEYDASNDILTIHKGFSDDEKFKGNLDVGDLVLDMSTAGRVRGIEILNASLYLKEFVPDLAEVHDADFTATVGHESIVLSIILQAQSGKIPAKIAVAIN
jgi:uncharacterized protein YuzE